MGAPGFRLEGRQGLASAEEQASGAGVPAHEVRAALAKVLASERFAGADSLGRFLAYAVEEQLAGRGDRLKAYGIATDVFERGDDFDPTTDSIVRVQASRLRTALDLYYGDEGRDDPVRIQLPKGGYRPVFERRAVRPGETPPGAGTAPTRWLAAALGLAAVLVVALGWAGWTWWADGRGSEPPPSVAMRIETAATPGDERAARALQDYALQLESFLSRNAAINIVPSIDTGLDVAPPPNRTVYSARLSGQYVGSGFQLVIRLVQDPTSRLMWARTYALGDDGGAGEAASEALTSAARDLQVQAITAYKLELARYDPTALDVEDLFLLATWVPGQAFSTLAWEQERVRLARLAIMRDPDHGPAHSVLADKLIYLASVDPPSNQPELVAEASAAAERALDRAPDDANVLFNVAIHRWHAGEIELATDAMRRAAELNASHPLAPILARVFPYTCRPAPDEILHEVDAFDRALGADNPVRWVTLTWRGILHMNRGEYEEGLRAERRAYLIFHTPDSVMRRAALANAVGNLGEARRVIEAERDNWPNLDPAFFAMTTIPRRCGASSRVVRPFEDLAVAMSAIDHERTRAPAN